MTGPDLFDRDRLVALLDEVAAELDDDGYARVIVVVGGSLLAWHGLRDATRDIDTIVELDQTLRDIVARVAARHDLAPRWLNDSARPWAPANLSRDHWELLKQYPMLTVFGIPLRFVFLMKLNRSDGADLTDMQRIWPLVADEFPSVEHVTTEFSAAFPTETRDPHLAAHVVDTLARAGYTLPATI